MAVDIYSQSNTQKPHHGASRAYRMWKAVLQCEICEAGSLIAHTSKKLFPVMSSAALLPLGLSPSFSSVCAPFLTTSYSLNTLSTSLINDRNFAQTLFVLAYPA